MLEGDMDLVGGFKDRAAGSEDEAMSVFELLFGGSHRHCTFPITVRANPRRIAGASVTGA